MSLHTAGWVHTNTVVLDRDPLGGVPRLSGHGQESKRQVLDLVFGVGTALKKWSCFFQLNDMSKI